MFFGSASQIPTVPDHFPKLVVLTYHDVVPNDFKGRLWFDCTVSELDQQLRTLTKAGVHFLTLDSLYGALAAGKRLPSKPMCITFADGYEGYYRYAIPILRKYKVPSAMFLHTGFVGSSIGRPKMTWSQLAELAHSSDVAIESETVSHPEDLGKLSPTSIQKELTQSKSTLEEKLKIRVDYLAYPNGKYNLACERAAQAAGYKLAFSEITEPVSHSLNFYCIDRYVHTKWRQALQALGRYKVSR